jgi:hypothetical protein
MLGVEEMQDRYRHHFVESEPHCGARLVSEDGTYATHARPPLRQTTRGRPYANPRAKPRVAAAMLPRLAAALVPCPAAACRLGTLQVETWLHIPSTLLDF